MAVNSIFSPSAMMVQVNEVDDLVGFCPPSTIAHGQCPQAFQTKLLQRAHCVARHIETTFRDDCSLFLHVFPEKTVHTVRGSYMGFKLTYEEDLLLLEALLKVCVDSNRLFE